jgi:cyclophilin family peptidyl-prolyl cis-trans isomerase
MIFRSFLALIGGLMIMATPASAKSNETTDAPPPSLPTFVDPDPANAPENVLLLDLSNGGMVAIRLMPQWAPAHVERIRTLTSQGFYNGVIFHRVIEGFMAQTGDPTGTGAGGSPLPDLKAEFNSMPHLRGTVSAARTSDPDSANSQFFIVFYPRFSLDRKYTVLGRVISGMDVVDRIERGEPPANPTRILRARMAAGSAAPVSAAPAEAAISVNDLNSSQSD